MKELRVGNSLEWKFCSLDMNVVRLEFKSIKDAHKVEHPENVDGILHCQWIRRDLLGMPRRWENNGLTLVIPRNALDRVIEELIAFEINFIVI